ncbi:MAG: hypothetical protein LLG44_11390 [Chloroflexi bacterium]|nr:hypothetical protein [Chloroflexota bacterium]
MREEILAAVQSKAVAGEIACADAHEVALVLSVSPPEIGKAVNRATGLRFNRCQLGLFGYGAKAENKHKIILAARDVPAEIEIALKARLVNDAIPCVAVWEVAEQFKYPRLGVANIVEALHFKVAPCQLGCF